MLVHVCDFILYLASSLEMTIMMSKKDSLLL